MDVDRYSVKEFQCRRACVRKCSVRLCTLLESEPMANFRERRYRLALEMRCYDERAGDGPRSVR